MQNEGAMTVTAKRLTLALCAAGVIGGAVGAIAVNHNNAAATGAAAEAAPVAAAAPAPVEANPQVALPDFTKLVQRNGPAVVNIRVIGGTKAGNRQRATPQFDENDPFFEFFRQFGMPQPRGPRGGGGGGGGGGGAPVVFGEGSGFIISPDGIILTNAHVVRDADEVTVKLQDRREYRAKVLGSDPRTDVAVLKVDGKNLPTVPLGSTRNLQVGEWVIAIGSPYGLESTVTAGVVSAKGRSLDGGGVQFIQTDVAVNPGNSGGPLFNTRGEVVGINSQIYSQSGGYQGLSFSIPIDVATRIKDQIVATGKVQHARLGVTVQEVGQDMADSFNIQSLEGALVSNVERGSAADKAGIKPGDIIRKANGQSITTSGDLSAMTAIARPGDKTALEVWRDGKVVQLNAILGNAADKPDRLERKVADVDQGAKLGLSLRPLEPIERRQTGIASGLLIEDAGGAAAIAGVQPGDVLLSVNGKPVSSIDQVRDLVGKANKSVALLIQRGDDRIFIPVRIG
jgi:serine protease Do